MRHSTWKRRTSIVLVAAGLVIPLAACGDDDDEATTATTAADQGDGGAYDTTTGGGGGGGAAEGEGTLTIEGFAFGEVSAAPGATVTVENADGTTHTVTSDDDAWDEVRVDGGDQGELVAPSEPGEYDFHCEIHSTMTGTLVVE